MNKQLMSNTIFQRHEEACCNEAYLSLYSQVFNSWAVNSKVMKKIRDVTILFEHVVVNMEEKGLET